MGVFIEKRILSKNVALTWDMAHHLYTRYETGPVVVVCERPEVILAALRKQWLRIIFQLSNEYSRNLSQVRRREIARIINSMRQLPFEMCLPDKSRAVFFIKPEDALKARLLGVTIYITHPHDITNMLVGKVLDGGVLVLYQS
ncbi:MAG TPA: hypothetical protein VF466_02890 [Candidatus Saccharimonadales bacterium]